jgi:predicted SprT family Zn-dependent metalloprotease
LLFGDVLRSWETGGTFYEKNKRVKYDPFIGTFEGSGKDILTTLICHEMAHIFETIAIQEEVFSTGVLQYYGLKKSKTNHHHNKLWRVIYRDLKLGFMLGDTARDKYKGVDLTQIKKENCVVFYAKKI